MLINVLFIQFFRFEHVDNFKLICNFFEKKKTLHFKIIFPTS